MNLTRFRENLQQTNCTNISPIFYILISECAGIVRKYIRSCVAILEGDIKGKMSLFTP